MLRRLLLLGLFAVPAIPAAAYPIEFPGEVGVRWPFRGTITSLTVQNDLGCCDLNVALGDTVFGNVELRTVIGQPIQYASATFEVPGHGVDGAGSFNSLDLADNNGPPLGFPPSLVTADRFGFASERDPGQPTALVDLHTGWSTYFSPQSLNLVDFQGSAWTGVNPRTGQVLPDYAPLASDFETAEIVLSITATSGLQSQTFNFVIHIDEFIDPVPEPPSAPLALAGLALVAALRSSAAGARRAGRAAAP